MCAKGSADAATFLPSVQVVVLLFTVGLLWWAWH
jgi:hypothetical protein